MSRKSLVVDFDLNDSEYRNKMNKLITDSNKTMSGMGGGQFSNLNTQDQLGFSKLQLSEMQRDFASRFSANQVEVARQRIAFDEKQLKGGANPLTYVPRAMSGDKAIVDEAKRLDDLNKNLQEASKLQQFVNYETKNRHQEYRTLTTTQLEQDRKRLRREAEKDEKAHRFSESDAKYEEISAISGVIAKRQSMSPELRAMRQIGGTMFMNDLVGTFGDTAGAGGRSATSILGAGIGAYGVASMAGMSNPATAAVVVAVMALKTAAEAFKQGEETTIKYFKTQGVIKTDADVFKDMSSKFKQLAISPGDIIANTPQFAKLSGGGDFNTVLSRQYASELMKRTMGLETQDLTAMYGYGRGKDRVEALDETRKLTYFLDKLGTQGVSLENGLANDLTLLPEYLKQLVTINEDIYKQSGYKGRANQELASSQYESVIGLGGIFKNNPELASSMLMGVRSSISKPSSDLEQYYNISAYRKTHEGASMVQMIEGAEKPDIQTMNERVKQIQLRYGKYGTIGEGGGASDVAMMGTLQQLFKSETKGIARQEYNSFVQGGGLKQYDVSVDTTADFSALNEATKDLTTWMKSLGVSFEDFLFKVGSSVRELDLHSKAVTSSTRSLNANLLPMNNIISNKKPQN